MLEHNRGDMTMMQKMNCQVRDQQDSPVVKNTYHLVNNFLHHNKEKQKRDWGKRKRG